MEAEIRYARCQLKQGKPADAEKSLHTLADRLRGERLPDTKAAGGASPDTLHARLDEAMKELEASGGADRTRLLEAAIDGMARTLSPHSGYISSTDIATLTGDFAGIGAVLAGGGEKPVVIRDTVPGSAAEKAGVPAETEIVEIDGRTPFALGGKLEGVVKAIRGRAGSSVKLRVRLPGGELKELNLVRSRLELKNQSCGPVSTTPQVKGAPSPAWWLDETSGIAGIAIRSVGMDCSKELLAILTAPPFSTGNVRGLVLDLWDNGGGHLEGAKETADLFLKDGVIVSEKSKDGIKSFKADAKEFLPGVPVVVLVNRRTASAAEIVAASLQDNQCAVIAGERTFGKGEINGLKNLPDGGALKVPLGEIVRPSGAGLEKREGMTEKDVWGVTPDIAVPLDTSLPEPAAAEAQHRAAIAAAVEHLKKTNAPK
jgi:carboxyl-terminal processing protease